MWEDNFEVYGARKIWIPLWASMAGALHRGTVDARARCACVTPCVALRRRDSTYYAAKPRPPVVQRAGATCNTQQIGSTPHTRPSVTR